MAIQLYCQHCGATLAVQQEVRSGAVVRCPVCSETFTVQPTSFVAAAPPPQPAAAPVAKAPDPVARPASQPAVTPLSRSKATPSARPVPSAAPASGPSRRSPTPSAANGRRVPARAEAGTGGGAGVRMLGGCALVCVVVLMLGALALLLWHNIPADKPAANESAVQPGPLAQGPVADPGPVTPTPVDTPKADPPPPPLETAAPAKKDKAAPATGPDIADLTKPDQPPPVLPLPKEPTKPPETVPPPDSVKPPPDNAKPPDSVKPPPAPEVTITVPGTPAVPGVDAARIKAAIAKGVQFVKGQQQPDGGFEPANHRTGHTALAMLALLECDVPATDPSVQNAVRYIRADAEQINDGYTLSAVILALDRLGEKRDRPLIQHLAMRLLAAQGADFAWSYNTRLLDPPTEQQIFGFLRTHWPWSAAQPRPDGALTGQPAAKGGKAQQVKLPRVDLAKLPSAELTWNRWFRAPGQGDNSNTQFALLALWAARRHGVPAECPILASYQHFLTTQQADGGWPYTVGNSTDTMTCAGLLGLAMGHGALPQPGDAGAAEKKDLLDNPPIQKALAFLGRFIGTPAQDSKTRPSLPNLYFLWSVERVGMLYDLKTIEGKDWYAWGAQALLANQNGNGSWGSAPYTGANPLANTCFALLFLKRCNLVPDLTENLRLQMVIRDPASR